MRDLSKFSKKGSKSGSKNEPRIMTSPEPEFYGTIEFYGDPDEILTDEKRFNKFIKSIESIVRKSLECKEFIKYLKEELKMDHCYFLKNIQLSKVVSLELHHTPFTLFDIVKIVASKMITENVKPFSTFLVAKKVVELHYKGMIGLVPVSKTIHELIHAGKVIVPPHIIFGNVQKFIEDYYKYIDTDYFKKLYALVTIEDEEISKINSLVISRPLNWAIDSKQQREDLKNFFEKKMNEIVEVKELKEVSENDS